MYNNIFIIFLYPLNFIFSLPIDTWVKLIEKLGKGMFYKTTSDIYLCIVLEEWKAGLIDFSENVANSFMFISVQ